MATHPNETILSVFTRRYHPFERLSDQLESLLRLTIDATGSKRGGISLPEVAVGNELNDVEEIRIKAEVESGSFRDLAGDAGSAQRTNAAAVDLELQPWCAESIPLQDAVSDSFALNRSGIEVPVRYHGLRIGTLSLEKPHGGASCEFESLEPVAKTIAHQTKRYELRSRIMASLGRDHMLVGASLALRRIDDFIEKASRVALPVIILGELGTRKDRIAYMLHHAAPESHRRLAEINCAASNPGNFQQRIQRALADPSVGALFLNGIDELSPDLQYALLGLLESSFSIGHQSRSAGTKINRRIYASASRDLERMVSEQKFCRALLWEFNFLNVTVPPLRNRREDIGPGVQYFLRKYSRDRTVEMQDAVLGLLERHDWHGNECELERVVARITALAETDLITVDDLRAHAPTLLESGRCCTGTTAGIDPSVVAPKSGPFSPNTRPGDDLSTFAQALLNEKAELAALSRFHPGLRKALIFLSSSFSEDIPFKDVAREAALSVSHLSHLFHKSLGASFKEMLSAIRIEKAKQELLKDPHTTITELAGLVGFGELRHFERTFKRLVGCTPREFRLTGE